MNWKTQRRIGSGHALRRAANLWRLLLARDETAQHRDEPEWINDHKVSTSESYRPPCRIPRASLSLSLLPGGGRKVTRDRAGRSQRLGSVQWPRWTRADDLLDDPPPPRHAPLHTHLPSPPVRGFRANRGSRSLH